MNIVKDAAAAAQGVAQAAMQKAVQLAPDSFIPGGRPDPLIREQHGQIGRPLSRLDEAAGRLASGEPVQVEVRGNDELARLASSFNGMVAKIAEREQRITQLAFNDVLTGLPNRTMFQQQIEQAFRAAQGNGGLFALHCLDLDQFKAINDSRGHEIGDDVLAATAKRLMALVRPGDTAARFGGDEFTILLEDVSSEADAVRVAQRVHEQTSVPFEVAGTEIFSTVSLGIAFHSAEYERPDEILRDADTAMYRAKANGRSRHELFSAEMRKDG